MGLEAGQLALVAQPTQAPVAEHMLRVGSASATHWAEVLQVVQAPAAQMGALAGQVAPVRHATHLLVVVSQSGVAPEQWSYPGTGRTLRLASKSRGQGLLSRALGGGGASRAGTSRADGRGGRTNCAGLTLGRITRRKVRRNVRSNLGRLPSVE